MILDRVHEAAARLILFLPHAIRQMARPERLISPLEVRNVIDMGEVIEDYPEDPRGRSCLLLGKGEDGRPIHVVCSPKDEYLVIITAYIPSDDEWTPGFRERTVK